MINYLGFLFYIKENDTEECVYVKELPHSINDYD